MLKVTILLIFWVLTALTLFTTIAPLSGSNQWWIRGWDFPRLHIGIVALLTAVVGLAVLRSSVTIGIVLLLACVTYQAIRIFPYTPWAAQEITLKSDVPKGQLISLVAANVLMENSSHADVIAMIKDEQPDVLFLMETDQVWVDAIAPALETYKNVVRYPLDNHYGLVFATNLKVTNTDVVFLSDKTIPTLLADLEGPTGQFFFVGLHPAPPVPGQDTDERDAQIRRAAQLADANVAPVVAMGDFNDVAWSRTSEQFKKYGNFRDPRIGRGILPSFDARSWWMRFPIDQFYLTTGIDLISFTRLGPVGSDHFPIKAVIAVQE